MAPRPRFQTLAPEKRAAILAAAAAEFSRAGFEGASYNRIIEEAGVSKGAMYYYFDDKEDLYLTTVKDAVDRLVAAASGMPPFADAHGFWDAVTELYRRVIAFFVEAPSLAGLAKSIVAAVPGGRAAALLEGYIQDSLAWFTRVVEDGRRLGAVRDDVDTELLVRLLFATGEAMDRWLLERWHDLPPDELLRLPERLVGFHVRLAAPLSLVAEREGGRSTEGRSHP